VECAAGQFRRSIEIADGFLADVSYCPRSRVRCLKEMGLRKVVSGIRNARQFDRVLGQYAALEIQQAPARLER
jgi:hypothetical protein